MDLHNLNHLSPINLLNLNHPSQPQPPIPHGSTQPQPPISHGSAQLELLIFHRSNEPESQTFKLTIDLSAYLSLDVGLDGLEAYDLRDLSQPTGTSEYDYDRELEVGTLEKADVSIEDDSEDADFDVENEQNNSEEDYSESLVDSDDHGSTYHSDADELLQAALEEEIPRKISANAEDDDGNPTKNVWNKMYKNGNMWPRNSDGKVSIAEGDMFVDKDKWSKVIREFAIQESFALQRIRNDRYKHKAVCKVATYTWRVHYSRLSDGVIWKIRSLKDSHSCLRLQENKMASHPWVA